MKHFICKLKRHIKRRYMHYLAGIITAGCVLCALLFPHALGRIIESARDICTSAAYYFAEIFETEHSIPATVNALPKIPFYPWLPETVLPSAPIPENFEKFKAMFEHYWEVWKSKENFVSYMNFLLSLLSSFSRVLLIIAPFVIIFVVLFRRYLSTENNDYDKDSRPLKAWKRFADKVYTPVKRRVLSFISFLKEHSAYPKVWLILWLLYFNAAAIVMEAIAFYLYFIMSFDMKNLYI